LTPAAQPASGGRNKRMRVQGETCRVSPCAIFARKDEGRRNTRPSMVGQLGHLLRGLGCWLWHLLCLFLGGELLLHLEGDGFGVHLVGSGGFLEN